MAMPLYDYDLGDFVETLDRLHFGSFQSESWFFDESTLQAPFGGYEFDFLSPVPRKWICLICQLPLKDPMQLVNCGHRLCRNCLIEALRRPRAVCPIDRAPIEPEKVYLDTGCKREVEDLKVKCSDSDLCTWTGEAHKTSCGYVFVQCNNIGCLKPVLRKDLLSHTESKCIYRKVECRFCSETITKCDENSHNLICKHYLVPCWLYACGASIRRVDMEDHLKNSCPLAPVPCEYSDLLGCKKQIIRCKMRQHMESAMIEHLTLSCTKTKQQEKCLEVIQKEHLAKITNTLRDKKYEFVMRCTITMGKEEKKFIWDFSDSYLKLCWFESSAPIYSDPFCLHGYKLVLFLHTREAKDSPDPREYEPQKLCVGFHVRKGKFDARLKWPFRKKFRFCFTYLPTEMGPESCTTFYVQAEQAEPRCGPLPKVTTLDPSYSFLDFIKLEGNPHTCRLTVEFSDETTQQ